MKWKLRHTSGTIIQHEYDDKNAALTYLNNMGESFIAHYTAIPITNNKKYFQMLTEGLVAGDLRHIVLPQISIDEYLPSDADSDNIVIGFFIKGVPEAILPFRDFLGNCTGVVDVAYSSSDTHMDTTVVYVEFARNLRIDDVEDLMIQVELLTTLSSEDFSMVFPSSSKKYPYSLEMIKRYFDQRTAKQNWKAQKLALDNVEEDE
jgi:hypothetical protein